MDYFPDYDLNWNVWDHDKAHRGDRFFMVRVGEGKTGIVMSGHFASEPYRDEDWSGRGRTTYYMDLDIDHIFHPERTPILTTAQLVEAIPDFRWTGGASGQMLAADQAATLEKLWGEFLAKVDGSTYDSHCACIAEE